MIGFVIGCMVGGTVGAGTMCLCFAAKQADEGGNHTDSER